MIAMSGSPTMLNRAEEAALFHDVLEKPVFLDALLDTVEQHVRATHSLTDPSMAGTECANILTSAAMRDATFRCN
jgi:hypothetical protein